MAELKLGLLLLWLALTGGYTGWQNPLLLTINLALYIGLVAWIAWTIPRGNTSHGANPIIVWAIGAISLAMAASTVINGAWDYGPVKTAVWVGYLGLYLLAGRWQPDTWNRAGLIALAGYLPPFFFLTENENVIAFNLLALATLASPLIPRPRLYWLGVAAAMGYLQSFGGLLAVGVITLILGVIQFRPRLHILAAVAFLVVIWYISPDSLSWRLQYILDGAEALSVWGIGPGNYHTLNGWPHAHNMPFTWLVECGILIIPALIAVSWAVIALTQGWGRQTHPWAVALLAAVAVWSLVDEPLHFWGPGVVTLAGLRWI